MKWIKKALFIIMLSMFLLLGLSSGVKIFANPDVSLSFTFSNSTLGGETWSSSYTEHTYETTDVTIVFENANKQSGTITDIPVTKGKAVTMTLKNSNLSFKNVTFVCRQWGTKAQTITLHYSTDGGSTFTSTGTTSSNFTITKNSLPSGTNAVKITFSSSSNQVGIESVSFDYVTKTITYHGNGSTTGSMSEKVFQSGSDVTLDLNEFEKSGYSFAGWNTANDGSGASYSNEANIKTLKNDLDLYAQWAQEGSYSRITFNANSGSGTMNEQIVPNNTLTSINSNVFIKDGFMFIGWSTSSSGDKEYNDGDLVSIDSQLDLYALWHEIPTSANAFMDLDTKASMKVIYTKETDYSNNVYSGTITEGDYIIYYGGKAIKNTITSNRLDYKEVSVSGTSIEESDIDGTIIWHIKPGESYSTIYNDLLDKYLASTGTKNQAQLLDSSTDDKSLWSITGSSTYEFVNKYNSTNSVNANLRNNGTFGFACYSTQTGDALTLYKFTNTPVTYVIDKESAKNQLSMQFCGMIEASMLDDLFDETSNDLTFGAIYGLTSSFSTLSLAEAVKKLNNGSLTLSGLSSTYDIKSTSIEWDELKGTDATGFNTVIESPEYYQWGIKLSNISDSNLTTLVTVTMYVCIDGYYYIMTPKELSVASLANIYVNAGDTSAYTSHLGMLGYLDGLDD